MDFTIFLPNEILCQIFTSHGFNHDDYISFINVSRSWRQEIPIYSRAAWHDIVFEMESMTQKMTPRQSLTRYLGCHVRRVLIKKYKSDKLHPFITNLLKFLVAGGCIDIEDLVFQRCLFDMNEEPNIPHLLHLLGRNLVELAFLQHESNLSFIRTIATCPKLEQFSFSVHDDFSTDEYNDLCVYEEPLFLHRVIKDDTMRHLNDYSTLLFSKMTCLNIGATIAQRQRLQPLLKNCPHLRMLRINANCPSPSAEIILTGQLDLDINGILTCCPNLEYLECNTPKKKEQHDVEKWMTQFRRKKDDGQSSTTQHDLRTLIYYEGRQEEYRSVLASIKKHAASLRTLIIGSGRTDATMNWNALKSTIVPNLQTLKLNNIDCDENSVASFIKHCPLLKHLVLCIRQQTSRMTFASVFQVLADSSTSSRRLHHLTVSNYHLVDYLYEEGAESVHHTAMDRLLQPFSEYLQSSAATELEELCVAGRFGHSMDFGLLFDSLSNMTRLRTLELQNRSFYSKPFGTGLDIMHANVSSSTSSNLHKLKCHALEKLVLRGMIKVDKTLFDALVEIKNRDNRLRVVDIVTLARDPIYDDLPTFLKDMLPFDYIRFSDRTNRDLARPLPFIDNNVDIDSLFEGQYTISVPYSFGSWRTFKVIRNGWGSRGYITPFTIK